MVTSERALLLLISAGRHRIFHIPQQMASVHLANADCAAHTSCALDNTLINEALNGLRWRHRQYQVHCVVLCLEAFHCSARGLLAVAGLLRRAAQ